MEASVEKGRIRIRFANELEQDAFEQIRDSVVAGIGSAHPVENTERELSCALSVDNFRKLRVLGCKLADDTNTRDVVAKLRVDLDRYDEESKSGQAAKADQTPLAYTFKQPPLGNHQVRGFRFLHSMPTPGLFGDVGSGKTFIVSTWADSLVKAGEPLVLVVVCPVNLIKHVWLEDVAKFTDLTAVSLREPTVLRILPEDYDEKGDPDDRLERARLRSIRRLDPASKKTARLRAGKRHSKLIEERFAQNVNVYVINPEGLRNDIKEKRVIKLCKRLRAEGKQIALIIDESSKLKSRTSRTYKSLKRIRIYCTRCVIMTGTPSPNGATDLWAQFSVLDGGKTLQPNFVDFRHDTCKEIVLRGVTWQDKKGKTHNATKWHPKPGMAMQIYRRLEPRVIRFRTQDCIDLPPKRFIVRDVEMNAEQVEIYEAMESMLFAEIEGEAVTAKIAAAKLMKLREITGGFVITDDRNEKQIGKDSPKMLELDALLEQSIADKLGDDGPPSKALVWAQYQWECKALVKRYQRLYGARGLFGGISSSAKDDAISYFKSDPKSRLLICHPGSVGHGLNLTEANFAFYYSLSHNYEEFYQSQGRMARPGQKRKMTYYFLVCPGTIDEELTDALRSKKDLSDIITDGKLAREQLFARREKPGVQLTGFDPSWGIPDLSAAAG